MKENNVGLIPFSYQEVKVGDWIYKPKENYIDQWGRKRYISSCRHKVVGISRFSKKELKLNNSSYIENSFLKTYYTLLGVIVPIYFDEKERYIDRSISTEIFYNDKYRIIFTILLLLLFIIYLFTK